MTFRIAVDTGGTFTDVVVTDATGTQWSAKAPTTPDDVFAGMLDALRVAGQTNGLELEQLLGHCPVFSYATTHATNAIITGRTARTAFLTTAGHPDVLVLREGGRFGPFDYTQEYRAPYVPRALTFEVNERIGYDGTILTPLDEPQVSELVEQLRRNDVEAVGICLLWSHVEPMHEQRLEAMLTELAPEMSVSVSSQVVPVIREYRRASATCIDASLKPLMTRHFSRIDEQLRSHGFAGELLTVTSTGGVVPVQEAAAKPILVVNSGPSIAPIGAQAAAAEEGIPSSLVVGDMGGTTFDISLVPDGRVHFARETWLDGQFVGHITGLPSVSVESIGYGGGSIAYVDDGGMLRVGPNSVGADPGPACYQQGGTVATFTDAAVAAGYIDPDAFLGGRIALSRHAAEDAIKKHVADPLSMDISQAAAAIIEIAVDAITQRTREAMAREGVDPADAVFVAGGGASGLCAAEIGRRLGCRQVLVPRTGPVLSASGGLHSDTVMEFSNSHDTDSDAFDWKGVAATLERLSDSMDGFLDRIGAAPDARRHEFIVEARYRHQVWELEVPLPSSNLRTEEDLALLCKAFHDAHERVYGVREPAQRIEFLYWRGRARAVNDAIPTTDVSPDDPIGAATDSLSSGPGVAARCRETDLSVGDSRPGPLFVDTPQSTLVVPDGLTVTRTRAGNFVLLDA